MIRQTFTAAILAVVLAAPPPPPATPQAFADQLAALYASAYATTGPGRPWDRWHDGLYDPALLKLIRDNRRLESEHGGGLFLDHDLICGCDADPHSARILSLRRRPDGSAEVKASYCDPTEPAPPQAAPFCDVDLIIRRIGDGWKLFDVLANGSWRDRLTRENARLRALPAGKDR